MKDHIFSVRDLTRHVKQWIEQNPVLQDIWVRGEISNFKHYNRGHMYLTLKDKDSRVRSVMFKGNNQFMKFMPKDGMNVIVRGAVNVYERDGQYQLYIKEMQPDGVGALYQAYEDLKAKLEQRGWFAENIKKPIPMFPQQIGVITSKSGAAVRDILTTIQRRFPIAEILVLPVPVQGQNAGQSIAQAINLANREDFDVLIIGRGGGSIEELWAFNEEIVAQGIYESAIPIISAVGHETDYTIADFVADLRAPTPTAAAELAVPVLTELMQRVSRSKEQLRRSLTHYIQLKRQMLERYQQSYAFKYPHQLLAQKEQQFDQISSQLSQEMKHILEQNKQQLELKILKLDGLSPLKIMKKGYSLVYQQEKEDLVVSATQIEPGQAVRVRMHDGILDCQVWGIKEVNRNE